MVTKDAPVAVLEEPYAVPEKLKAFREALEEKLVGEGKFNGPVAVLDGEFSKTLRLRKGVKLIKENDPARYNVIMKKKNEIINRRGPMRGPMRRRFR